MAANPARGESDIEIDGKTYTLVMTTNGMCALQKKTGKTHGELLASLTKIDMVSLRDLFHALLQRHHAKQFKDVEAVGNLIDAAGGFAAISNELLAVLNLNKRPADDTGGEANPLQAQADGTGNDSTETPGTSD